MKCKDCKNGKYKEIVNGKEKRFCLKHLLEHLTPKTKTIINLLNN
jgi:hypothetical protein